MIKFRILFLFSVFAVLASHFAYARTVTTQRTVTTTPAVNNTTSYRGAASESSPRDWWLGLASDATFVDTAVPALSALVTLSDKVALQTYASISSVNPFNFGVGGALKYNVVGDMNRGLHLGGGVGLGLTGSGVVVVNNAAVTGASNFYVNVNALAGVHFHIIDQVLVSVDGGAHLSVSNGTTNFTVGGDSNLLGISVMYRL